MIQKLSVEAFRDTVEGEYWSRRFHKRGVSLIHVHKPLSQPGLLEEGEECFADLEETDIWMLALRDVHSQKVVSYIGYRLEGVKDERVVVLEFLCTVPGQRREGYNKLLREYILQLARFDKCTGFVAWSVNDASGKALARMGFAKVHPDVYLDLAARTQVDPSWDAMLTREYIHAYCIPPRGSQWSARAIALHLWRTHRQVAHKWKRIGLRLPPFNSHLLLQ